MTPASVPPSHRARVALRRAVIFVTTHCNFRCGFCEFAADTLAHERKIHFPLDRWESLLSDLRRHGCRELYLTGGEPLLHPDFWEMVEMAHRAEMPIHRVTSNGSHTQRLGERERRLSREAIDAISISIDSPRADEHDRSRGFEGAFARLAEFIGQLRESAVRVHVTNVITRDSFICAAEVVELAAALGIEHVNFQPCTWQANYGDYEPIAEKRDFQVPLDDLDALERSLAEAQRTARGLGVSTNLPILRRWVRVFTEGSDSEGFFFDRVLSRFRCLVPHTAVYIGADGEVFPCTPLRSVGTLKKNSFDDLWSSAMQEIRDHLDQGKFYPECRSCHCDFPSNIRHNLTRHPLRNIGFAIGTFPHYIQRLRTI